MVGNSPSFASGRASARPQLPDGAATEGAQNKRGFAFGAADRGRPDSAITAGLAGASLRRWRNSHGEGDANVGYAEPARLMWRTGTPVQYNGPVARCQLGKFVPNSQRSFTPQTWATRQPQAFWDVPPFRQAPAHVRPQRGFKERRIEAQVLGSASLRVENQLENLQRAVN